MLDGSARIAIAGAGSVGCYVGGALAAAGRNVALLARQRIAEPIRGYGLRVSDHEGRERLVGPDRIDATSDPAAALSDADVILVTAKSGATAEMAGLIAAHAPARAVVMTLQNGVRNRPILREILDGRAVLAGEVPFNVVQEAAPGEPFHVHRASSGKMLIERGVDGLRDLLHVEGLSTGTHTDMPAVLWGKLLLNLNNALGALSGLTLVEELSDRRWRRILADMMAEGLAAMKASGIRPLSAAGPPPAMIPQVLRLHDGLFRLIAGRTLTIDPKARSSMWQDLARGRRTEIDELQGAVIRLAEAAGTAAPLNAHVMRLVRTAEERGAGSPQLRPEEVAPRR